MLFDQDKYKVWQLPHPLLLHWIINPGIAINELVLGQRLPKVMLIDKTSDAPLMERQFVPCPECHALNDARLWSKQNAFGHWFGYVCPECGGKIPCLWNITSLIVLAVTFPIWIWLKMLGEKKWLEKEKTRFTPMVKQGLPEARHVSWLKMGLNYGLFMFAVMVLPKIFQGQLSAKVIATQAAVWLVAGVTFGFVMKLILGRKAKVSLK